MDQNKFLFNHAVSFEFDKFTFGFSEHNFLYIKAVDSINGRKWKVCTHFEEVWDKELKCFVIEPSPSERDKAFLKETRFEKIEDAIEVIKSLSDPEAEVWDQ